MFCLPVYNFNDLQPKRKKDNEKGPNNNFPEEKQ
jgi:hypothetical protein